MVKLKCDICEEGEGYETDNPYDMISHLEVHCRNSEKLINKILEMKDKKNERRLK